MPAAVSGFSPCSTSTFLNSSKSALVVGLNDTVTPLRAREGNRQLDSPDPGPFSERGLPKSVRPRMVATSSGEMTAQASGTVLCARAADAADNPAATRTTQTDREC